MSRRNARAAEGAEKHQGRRRHRRRRQKMATADITEFVQKVVDAMDLDLEASAEEMPDGVRINLTGGNWGMKFDYCSCTAL